MQTDTTILETLINRGDIVEIVNGILRISPTSGKEVPPEWMRKHHDHIVLDIARTLCMNIYSFDKHSTGRYGRHKAEGVTLGFTDQNGEYAYSIFNAKLTRARDTKHGKEGDPLPKGQFRIGKRFKLYQFWISTGLPLPDRPYSTLYRNMGKLKSLMFAADPTIDDNTGRLIKESIKPLTISYSTLKESLAYAQPLHNPDTTSAQPANKMVTRNGNKPLPQDQGYQGPQPNLTTCIDNHDISYQDSAFTSAEVIPITIHKTPEEQTDEEWLKGYCS